jgi:OPT family small oligopeptide transporter
MAVSEKFDASRNRPTADSFDIEKRQPVVEVSDADLSEILETLRETIKEHELDPNFPPEILNSARAALRESPNKLQAHLLQGLVAEIQAERDLLLNDSPYAEVRAVVDNTDDPSTPVNTFRAWFLGILFTILGTGIDQFFSLRYPGIYLYTVVAQLLSYPCGLFLARVLPTTPINVFGTNFSLNPGPFNQKEHMLISIMSNVAYGGLNGTAYVTSIFQVLKLDMFYGMKELADSAGFQILLTLSTQLIGYGCAGIARRFLVYPPVMLWPKNLAQIALNRALHNDDNSGSANGWTMSRYRFFLYCFGGMFFYFWFPDYIFQAMSYFNWMTWIAPQNVKLAIITGSIGGLGFNPLPTFDWNVVSYAFDPIVTPFFSLLNNVFGMAVVGIVVILPVYFCNVWNTAYLPINSNDIFDNTGNDYNVSRILSSDFTLDVEAYEAYSPAYLGAANAVLYSAFFAIYLATLVYAALYYHREIISGFRAVMKWKNARDEYNDVHNRLMRQYKEAPEWWYLTILAIAFAMGCICCKVYDTGMPIWGIVVGLLLCVFLQIPIGIVMGVTNIEVTNNVIAEFIGGYAVPNNPVANMIFKSYGYIAAAQSVQFVADLKLGHYMKIPPRTMFIAQTIATIVAGFVSIGVNAWQLSNINDVCSADQSANFTCPGKHPNFHHYLRLCLSLIPFSSLTYRCDGTSSSRAVSRLKTRCTDPF